MSRAERKRPEDVLVGIDSLLARTAFTTSPEIKIPKPVTFQEVKTFTSSVYTYGTPEEQDELGGLKDKVVDLVIDKLNKKYFPIELHEEFSSLRKSFVVFKRKYPESSHAMDPVRESAKASIDMEYRDFREKSLSYVLSTNPDLQNNQLMETVKDIRERYHTLYKGYYSRRNL